MIPAHDDALPAVTLNAQDIALLLSIVEEGTFTGAALKLEITQSAVSRSVQQMERLLGVELFQRGRKGATPSDALLGVLPRMRGLQTELRSIADELTRSATTGLRGSVRIAGFRSAVSVLLPPAVSKFLHRHPDVHVSVSAVREHGAGVVQCLEDGTADFALTTVKPPTRYRAQYLGSDRYVAVRAAGAGPMDSATENLVLWRERCSEVVPDILRAHNWSVSNRLEVDTDTAVLAMVAHGGGFTIMPELAVEPLPANLEKWPLTNEFRRRVWLCAPRDAFDSRIGRELSGYIRAVASSWLKK